MNDLERVVRGISICLDRFHCDADCPYYNSNIGCMEQLRDDALTLLKKQEPVRPRWTHPAVDMNVMMCGNCGIEIPVGRPNYCPWCGRKVKWE